MNPIMPEIKHDVFEREHSGISEGGVEMHGLPFIS